MLKKGDKVFVNHIVRRAIFDSVNLPLPLKNTIDKLKKFDCNPAEVVSITILADSVNLSLKVAESYGSNSVPAVMCEAYSSGQGEIYSFENLHQTEIIFSQDNVIDFTNISPDKIQASQIVRLIYNNKNLVIMPVTKTVTVEDYHGVIGRSAGLIEPYQKGPVQLRTVTQLMDGHAFNSLTIRGRRGF